MRRDPNHKVSQYKGLIEQASTPFDWLYHTHFLAFLRTDISPESVVGTRVTLAAASNRDQVVALNYEGVT